MKTPTVAALLAALLLAVPGAAQLNLRVEQRVRIVAPAAGLTAPTPATGEETPTFGLVPPVPAGPTRISATFGFGVHF